MKRLALVLLISLGTAPATFGESGTWSGTISDSQCALSHKEKGPATGGQTLTDRECIELCLSSRAKYVFVTDNAVYAIANQNFKDVRANAGNTVQLTGDLEATTITVSKIAPIRKKASGKT